MGQVDKIREASHGSDREGDRGRGEEKRGWLEGEEEKKKDKWRAVEGKEEKTQENSPEAV